MDVPKSESRAITIAAAAKVTGLRTKLLRALIRDGLLASKRLGRNYYTSRHAISVFTHGLVTCAPIRVTALVDAPTP